MMDQEVLVGTAIRAAPMILLFLALMFRMFPLSYLWRPRGAVEGFALSVIYVIEKSDGWDGNEHITGPVVSVSPFAGAVALNGKQVDVGWYYKVLIARAWDRKVARDLEASIARFNRHVGHEL